MSQTNDFEQAFQKVIELEGGFTLHKNKTEKAQTYAGIYRAAHPNWEGWSYVDKGDQPPTQLVREFYHDKFYKPYKELDAKKAYMLFEFAVNAGHKRAVIIAQRAAEAVDDGIMGRNTKKAIGALDEEVFALRFTLARIAFYNALAAKDQYRPYIRGWINRALEIIS